MKNQKNSSKIIAAKILLGCVVCVSSLNYTMAGDTLPRAEDVLPKGEVSKGSLVVKGPDYRYQIKPGYQKINLSHGVVGYRGTEQGFVSKATVTMFVTTTPFSGDLNTLVNKLKADIVKHGGNVSKYAKRSSAVTLFIAGKSSKGYRQWAKVGNSLRLYVAGLYNKKAYMFHCVTPYKATAWANVGTACIIRGATFHIAPPK